MFTHDHEHDHLNEAMVNVGVSVDVHVFITCLYTCNVSPEFFFKKKKLSVSVLTSSLPMKRGPNGKRHVEAVRGPGGGNPCSTLRTSGPTDSDSGCSTCQSGHKSVMIDGLVQHLVSWMVSKQALQPSALKLNTNCTSGWE